MCDHLVLRRAFLRFDDTQPAVIDIRDFALDWEGLATLQGPSGSGKTSLFRLLCGWYQGKDPNKLCLFNRPVNPWLDVRLVGGHASLFPWKTVLGNAVFQVGNDQVESVGRGLVEVGLKEAHLGRYVYELSLGMFKRVELVLAVLSRPSLLLLDEFFSSIDSESKTKVQEFLLRQRGPARTLVSVHEAELREWIGGKKLRFGQNPNTGTVTRIIRV